MEVPPATKALWTPEQESRENCMLRYMITVRNNENQPSNAFKYHRINSAVGTIQL